MESARDVSPIRLAIVDDYDVVLTGLAHMFDNYPQRIDVVELDANVRVAAAVDVTLYDSFAQSEATEAALGTIVRNPCSGRVAVYTWTFAQQLVDDALAKGARGYLSKTLPARELVEAIEAIHRGEIVVSKSPPREISTGLDWPGRTERLSERESEIVALITQGRSNAEIARIAYLSINSVKSYIRSAYRKMGVANRVEAVLWGIDHGFTPDHHRLRNWET
jgi:DNA-binding NarL/FixJ family response regulator